MKKFGKIATAAVVGIMMAAVPMSAYAAESTESAEAVHALDFEEAVSAVMTDAGLDEKAVTFSKKMQDFDDGINAYEIDFIIPGQTKYDYKINAVTGDILESGTEAWEADDDAEYKALLDEKVNYFDFDSDEASKLIADSMLKSLDESAVGDEGIFYYKTGMEYDDGMILFENGFLVPEKMKFEFKFDAKTGELIGTDHENWKPEYDLEYADLLNETTAVADQASAAANQAAKVADQAAAAAEKIVDEAAAKAAALKDAGLTEGEVRITKCEKDIDDGIEEFDVEFVGPDGKEYEYEISVADGSILSKNAEFDD